MNDEPAMNDDYDSLESELANLNPVVPSSQLRDRIGKQLAGLAPAAGKGSWRLPLAVAAATSLAASLLVILWPPNFVLEVVPFKETAAPPPQGFDPSSPSVWSYHWALTDSNQPLDGVLDLHSVPTTPSDELLSPASAYRTFTSANPAALGEL